MYFGRLITVFQSLKVFATYLLQFNQFNQLLNHVNRPQTN